MVYHYEKTTPQKAVGLTSPLDCLQSAIDRANVPEDYLSMHTFFNNVSVLEKWLSNLGVTLLALSLLIAKNVCILLLHDTRELYTSVFCIN